MCFGAANQPKRAIQDFVFSDSTQMNPHAGDRSEPQVAAAHLCFQSADQKFASRADHLASTNAAIWEILIRPTANFHAGRSRPTRTFPIRAEEGGGYRLWYCYSIAGMRSVSGAASGVLIWTYLSCTCICALHPSKRKMSACARLTPASIDAGSSRGHFRRLFPAVWQPSLKIVVIFTATSLSLPFDTAYKHAYGAEPPRMYTTLVLPLFMERS